jgi:hypothetical protein
VKAVPPENVVRPKARVSALALCAEHTGGFAARVEHSGPGLDADQAVRDALDVLAAACGEGVVE